MDEGEQGESDVVPRAVAQAVMIGWLVLFAGRWVLIQLLLAGGLLSPAAISNLDEHVLVICYLVLLIATVAIMALRAVRSIGSGSDRGHEADPVLPATIDTADRGPIAGD